MKQLIRTALLLTGVFNGKWRAVANYRDQWSSFLNPVPFRTYCAAADMRFNVVNDDYASFGIGVMHDEAGTARFVQNKFHVSGAFLKQLSGGRNQAEHYLSAGAQLGAGQNSIDWSRIWFSRQFNTATEQPDTGLPSNEPNANAATNMYLDFNAGLLWYVVFPNEGFFYAGGAMHHLNAPSISLTGDDRETLYSRWTGHLGAQLPLNEVFSLLPAAQIMKQGPAFETNVGMNVRYSNNDLNELALRAGAWARIGNRLNSGLQADAVVITGMFEQLRYHRFQPYPRQ
jgi:type IX secretion system PorP/SprF family membrane protein